MLSNEMIVEDLRKLGYDAEVIKVPKNRTFVSGIVIKRGLNQVCPVIYDAISARDALMKHNLYLSRIESEDYELDRDCLLKEARLGVYRADWNKELFEHVANAPVGETDLSYYIYCAIKEGRFRFKVTKTLMDDLDISWEELFEAAKHNEDYHVYGVLQMLKRMGYDDISDDCEPRMRILTNEGTTYGASVLCNNDILDEALRILDSERMYIIPSSVHELLCIPEDVKDTNGISAMIEEVNHLYVRDPDQLSDHAYIYEDGVLRNC